MKASDSTASGHSDHKRKDIVAVRHRNFQCALHALLTAYVAHVDAVRNRLRMHSMPPGQGECSSSTAISSRRLTCGNNLSGLDRCSPSSPESFTSGGSTPRARHSWNPGLTVVLVECAKSGGKPCHARASG